MVFWPTSLLYIKGSLRNIQFQFLHDNANLMLLKGSTNTDSAGRKDWVAPTHISAAVLSYLHRQHIYLAAHLTAMMVESSLCAQGQQLALLSLYLYKKA